MCTEFAEVTSHEAHSLISELKRVRQPSRTKHCANLASVFFTAASWPPGLTAARCLAAECGRVRLCSADDVPAVSYEFAELQAVAGEFEDRCELAESGTARSCPHR